MESVKSFRVLPCSGFFPEAVAERDELARQLRLLEYLISIHASHRYLGRADQTLLYTLVIVLLEMVDLTSRLVSRLEATRFND